MGNKINDLTLANLQWLTETGYSAVGRKLDQKTLDTLLRAKCMILGTEVPIIGCWSCEAQAQGRVAASVLEQYKAEVFARYQELLNAETITDDIVVEKIIDQSYDETNSILSQTSIKRKKKNEE